MTFSLPSTLATFVRWIRSFAKDASLRMPDGSVLRSQAIADRLFRSGRLVDALRLRDGMTLEQRSQIRRMPQLSNWECVLEEILDTDHDPEYYVPFVHELFVRGFALDEIQEMRRISCENAGWFNYQMMAWEWGFLNEDDLRMGLNDRYETGDIDLSTRNRIEERIQHFSHLHSSTPDPPK